VICRTNHWRYDGQLRHPLDQGELFAELRRHGLL
jgi:hypothetical protein